MLLNQSPYFNRPCRPAYEIPAPCHAQMASGLISLFSTKPQPSTFPCTPSVKFPTLTHPCPPLLATSVRNRHVTPVDPSFTASRGHQTGQAAICADTTLCGGQNCEWACSRALANPTSASLAVADTPAPRHWRRFQYLDQENKVVWRCAHRLQTERPHIVRSGSRSAAAQAAAHALSSPILSTALPGFLCLTNETLWPLLRMPRSESK